MEKQENVKKQKKCNERHSQFTIHWGRPLTQLKLMLARAVKHIIQRRIVICRKDTDLRKTAALTHILLSVSKKANEKEKRT